MAGRAATMAGLEAARTWGLWPWRGRAAARAGRNVGWLQSRMEEGATMAGILEREREQNPEGRERNPNHRERSSGR